ncbi:MAG: NAD-glutamate dehydrogenase domain-containing protein, partial [Acidimicrobiales bacterium]
MPADDARARGPGDPPADPVDDPWEIALLARVGDRHMQELAVELGRHAPASYRERTSPDQAALDLAEILALAEAVRDPTTASDQKGHQRFVVRPLPAGKFHIRRFADRPVELTALLPLIESFGLVVEDSVPHRRELEPGLVTCIDDIGVRLSERSSSPAAAFDPALDGHRLVEAVDAVVQGLAEIDRLNGLVSAAQLQWREVSVLRAYASYWAQCGPSIPSADLEDAALAFPGAARALIDYFVARFDPSSAGTSRAVVARAACVAELGKVPALQADRALRIFMELIDATVRTNYFQRDVAGQPHETVSFKLVSASVPHLRAPRPRVETWVHGPRVAGIHLRAGLVARGGIRWSERPEDFRTEVLDLMVAQVKKNAIIVPTGAKGGFVCRTGVRPSLDDVRRCYLTFVRSLLDVTDNLAAGEVEHPSDVVVHDAADPYLVVAADKGTADFSDLANAASAESCFWLGDAFASGGSHGYNHKEMGITAHGAWVAVRRHFHQLGIDVQREPVSVAGVGDMSGDVFGNGMLCSETIRLVAAFDHRHVFLDPTPDEAVSYAERKRLASLTSSSWVDYSRDAISPGGGVWPRDTKSIPLAPEARRALGIDAESLPPPELVSAILEAPVDLLWFGGIGTFVKAEGEPIGDIGDHANDEVRITAERIRARVVGEGGNLGLTQRARIRYSRRGGRINTDFIDNAAGVATSDREVNLKILLAQAAEEGRLDPSARDDYLGRAQLEVAGEVLRQVSHSVATLTRSVPDSADQLDAYAALLDLLESNGELDRRVEALPDGEELAVRRGAGAGMIRPELAVLLAYAKSDLSAAIESAPLIADASLKVALHAYFPAAMRQDFADQIDRHRLHDQILATELAGEIVDNLGVVWAHETAAELGEELANVAGGFWAARQVVGADPLWRELDERWSELSADADAALHRVLSEAVAALARRYVRRGDTCSPSALVAEDLPVADDLAVRPPSSASLNELVVAGIDRPTAERWLSVAARARAGEIGPLVRATGRTVEEIVAAFEMIDDAAGTARMRAAIERTPPTDRWRSWLARA